MELGRIGVWTSQLGTLPASVTREVVPEIEALGYGAIWYPEGVTKEAMAQAALILAAGPNIVVAPGIANIWARDAMAMINGARTLADAFGDRFLLGIGVSHAPTVARRGHDYRRPLTAMREYLDAVAEAPYFGPQPPDDPPMVLAALGPKMLRLSAERAWGAHPYFVPVEHTSFARSELGAGPLLAPEQAVVLSADPVEARAIAREHAHRYLALDNYRNNLLRMGWRDADVVDEGSDAIIDAVIAWGDLAAIQARVAAHLEAGADHVCVQVLNGEPERFPLDELRRLAPVLLELG
jgi:probable F420-dependent oxidoreductase